MSYHRVMVRRRVAPGHEMLELALDGREQRRRPEPEQIGSQPARTPSYSASHAPASACARVITTSISCAPAATEALISSMRWGRGFNPAGNPVDTAATGIAEPCKASTASGTKAW